MLHTCAINENFRSSKEMNQSTVEVDSGYSGLEISQLIWKLRQKEQMK